MSNITVFVQHAPGNWLSDLLLAIFGTRICQRVRCDSIVMDRINVLLICESEGRDAAEVFNLNCYAGHKQTKGWKEDGANAKAKFEQLTKTMPGAIPGTLEFGGSDDTSQLYN